MAVMAQEEVGTLKKGFEKASEIEDARDSPFEALTEERLTGGR
jgi:hypothetical protein